MGSQRVGHNCDFHFHYSHLTFLLALKYYCILMFSSLSDHSFLNSLRGFFFFFLPHHRLLWWLSGKESACQSRRCRRHRFDPWVSKILWSRKWQPTPVFLPVKSHGQRSLEGYSPNGPKESDTSKQLSAHIIHMACRILVLWSGIQPGPCSENTKS